MNDTSARALPSICHASPLATLRLRLMPMSRFPHLATCRPFGAAALAALAIFIVPVLARGGDWHTQGHGLCSDCHTQHNSAGGAPMRTDNDPTPAAYLLRRDTVDALCLSCHDGSNPSAPDVLAPVSYVADPAGGAFANAGGTDSGTGHSLMLPAQVPPGGTISMSLSCTTCHDPHGNDNYRNLRPDPTGSGLTPVTVVAKQTTLANGTNPAQVYIPANIVDKSGISAWCEQCHAGPIPGSDHPADKTMWGSTLASYANWTAVTGYRVRAGSPSDDTYPSQDDTVLCISCHKAHGNGNPYGIVYADGVTQDSTCQECHNQ